MGGVGEITDCSVWDLGEGATINVWNGKVI